jgi:hypothetical protein
LLVVALARLNINLPVVALARLNINLPVVALARLNINLPVVALARLNINLLILALARLNFKFEKFFSHIKERIKMHRGLDQNRKKKAVKFLLKNCKK